MNHLPWILRAQGLPEDGDVEAGPEKEIISGVVATVNHVEGTCTTTDGLVIRLGPWTAEVADVLTQGDRIQIDAEGVRTADGLIATEVWIRPE